MEKFIKGVVEVELVSKDGIVKSKSENNFLIKGEDIIAKFLARSFASGYDTNEGATQAGYFDFVAFGTGFKTPIAGTDRVLVLPNKPVGIADDAIDAFDGMTVKILSGLNSGNNGVVAVDGYNSANQDYEGRPTITLSDPLNQVVEADVQFVINPIASEVALQGETRADYKGASFLNPAASRVPVNDKKTLSGVSNPVGAENEIYIQAAFPPAQLSGGDSILICEAALVNTDQVPASADVASGLSLARVSITPTEKGADDTINVYWRLRIGAQRELSI